MQCRFECYLKSSKSLKKKFTAASVGSEGPEGGRGQGREVKAVVASWGSWEGMQGLWAALQVTFQGQTLLVPGGGGIRGRRVFLRPSAAPWQASNLPHSWPGKRVTFTHCPGPPSLSGHPGCGGGDRCLLRGIIHEGTSHSGSGDCRLRLPWGLWGPGGTHACPGTPR